MSFITEGILTILLLIILLKTRSIFSFEAKKFFGSSVVSRDDVGIFILRLFITFVFILIIFLYELFRFLQSLLIGFDPAEFIVVGIGPIIGLPLIFAALFLSYPILEFFFGYDFFKKSLGEDTFKNIKNKLQIVDFNSVPVIGPIFRIIIVSGFISMAVFFSLSVYLLSIIMRSLIVKV